VVELEETSSLRAFVFALSLGVVGSRDVVVVVVVDARCRAAWREGVVVEVVAVVAVDSAGLWRAGVDEAVKVNTSTRRSSGLDQITQCVLLSERSNLISTLEG